MFKQMSVKGGLCPSPDTLFEPKPIYLAKTIITVDEKQEGSRNLDKFDNGIDYQ